MRGGFASRRGSNSSQSRSNRPSFLSVNCTLCGGAGFVPARDPQCAGVREGACECAAESVIITRGHAGDESMRYQVIGIGA